jgi:deoxyuridine 5'-triphosphate nucleotidohydrolase
MQNSKLLVQRLSAQASLPAKASASAAGYDLKSAEQVTVPAGKHKLVLTDLSIAVPAGTYGRIAPRSGLALKCGLDVLAGVVDRDYRGNVGVILINHSTADLVVQAGDRIAQLILEKIDDQAVVEEVRSLDATSRGEGGFGSTGK